MKVSRRFRSFYNSSAVLADQYLYRSTLFNVSAEFNVSADRLLTAAFKGSQPADVENKTTLPDCYEVSLNPTKPIIYYRAAFDKRFSQYYQRFSTYSQNAYMSLISSFVPSSRTAYPFQSPCT